MDRDAFLRAVSISSDAVGNERWHEVATAASDLIEAGELAEKTAASIVFRTLMEQPPLVLAALQVAVRLEPRFKDTGTEWVVGLIDVVRGLYFDPDDPDAPAVDTDEDLDAAAVVVEFILRFRSSHLSQGHRTDPVTGVTGGWKKIADEGLDGQVGERPSALDLILAYLQERGMLRGGEADMEGLRAWLDAPASDSGWLGIVATYLLGPDPLPPLPSETEAARTEAPRSGPDGQER